MEITTAGFEMTCKKKALNVHRKEQEVLGRTNTPSLPT
jgi:hypothetical protein